MPGRYSRVSARGADGTSKDGVEIGCTGGSRVSFRAFNLALGAAIIVWASIMATSSDRDSWPAWPTVKDSWITPPHNGFKTGEVKDASYNIYWVIFGAGVAHFVLSGFTMWKFWGPVDESMSRVMDMIDTAGYHGVTDALLGWAIYKHQGIVHTHLLIALLTIHFLGFYLIGVLQTETNDIKAKSQDYSFINQVFLNLPSVLALLVFEGYVLWSNFTYTSDYSEINDMGEWPLSIAAHALAPMYFFLTVFGVFSAGGNLLDAFYPGYDGIFCVNAIKRMTGVRLHFNRLAATGLRFTIVFVLLYHNCHYKPYVVHDQANYPVA